jgi:hypothetical protein
MQADEYNPHGTRLHITYTGLQSVCYELVIQVVGGNHGPFLTTTNLPVSNKWI